MVNIKSCLNNIGIILEFTTVLNKTKTGKYELFIKFNI